MVYSPSATSCESLADGASQVHPGAQNDKYEVEEGELDDSSEELYTTIKIMASEGGKPKDPDVRLGINQHYPSFKPPPFPYHNRTPAGSVTSATNFTTHNIPQTFSTAIRCTKCGKSFDNMPELHKHILACANASDKKRYTPKKNPVPLKQIAKPPNGAVSPVMAISTGPNASRRIGQPKKLSFSQEPSSKVKLSVLNKKKNQLVQKAISQRNKSSAIAKKDEQQESHVCPHCNREFTYLGSLNKHVTVSCPMKPVLRQARKSGTESVAVQDKNANLRRRTADAEIKQQGSNTVRKPLGKTRAQSSGPAGVSSVPLKLLPSRGKTADLQVRPKRPAALQPALVPLGKKSKKDGALQPSPSLAFPNSSTQRSGMRMQRGGKEASLRKMEEAKSQQQSKKEERFSTKTRERVGGPVTRSVQLATVTSQTEAKAEDFSSQQTRESQETLLKLAR
ncbi:PR domain zinc finger protein 2 isoform X1 [Arapaima gigas]